MTDPPPLHSVSPEPDPIAGNLGRPPPDVLDWARRRLAASGDPEAWTILDGGRTNRLWRMPGTTGDLVVKLYAPGMASRLFPNSPGAEARALQRLAGTGLVPVFCGSGTTAAGHVLSYRAVDGTCPSGPEGAAAVARALADLHARPDPGGVRRVSLRPDALARGILADLASVPPGAAVTRLRHFAARAPARMPRGSVADSPAVLLHGDPVASNALLVRPNRVTLIDWQCPARGDPLHDVAIALSAGMRVLYHLAPPTGAERASFWQAYGDDRVRVRHATLAPLLSARLAAHFLAQASRGRDGYAAAAAAELAASEE